MSRPRSIRLSAIPVALGILLIPSLATAQVASHDPATGCYSLQLGDWSPAPLPGNIPYHTPPAEFTISAEQGEGVFERESDSAGRVRPVIPHGRTPNAYWLRESPDAVTLIWTNGFAGVLLHLEQEGRALVGTATAFTDQVGAERPKAPVRAVRIECDPEARG